MIEEKIIFKELAKLGAIGGGVGGLVAGDIFVTAAGAGGGAAGAWVATKFVPTESFIINEILKLDAAEAFRFSVSTLANIGKVLDSSEIVSPFPVLLAVVGSGFMKLNPCIVTMEFFPLSEALTKVIIIGSAKEGIIKQKSAQNTAEIISNKLKNYGV